MLKRIRTALGQRGGNYRLRGVIEFVDAYLGGPASGQKWGRGTVKARVFVALSLDAHGNPRHLKMRVIDNIRQAAVKKFAKAAFADDSTIYSDGYRNYIPALTKYTHEYKTYVPGPKMLHWLHIMISNAKAFILGAIIACPRKSPEIA